MKLKKYFPTAIASMEAEVQAEARRSLQSNVFSTQELAIECQRDGAAELAAATVESLHAARRLDSDASELCELESNAQDLRSAIALVNNNGGFTVESLGWANVATAAVLSSSVGTAPTISFVSAADNESDRRVVNLESLDDVIKIVGEVRADVEAKSVDAILRVFDTLKDAMPEVKARMIALKQALPSTEYDQDKEIRLDDLVFKSLAVDGAIPSSFGSYLGTYNEFATTILSAYSENALEAASKSPQMAEAIAKLGQDCPIRAIAAVYRDIGDPRLGISADQLCFALPGSGPLFGNKVDVLAESATDQGDDDVALEDIGSDVGTEDLIQRLKMYCTNRAPLDPLNYADRDDAEGENPTIRVLSKDSIDKGLTELISAFEVIDIKSYAEARRMTWVQARSAYGAFQQQLINLEPSQVAAVRPVCPALSEYLDMVFALSAWPSLHLLTNMVFTANAFLLLSERSIAGKTEVPIGDVPADTAEVHSDADADAAAEPALPAVDDASIAEVPESEEIPEDASQVPSEAEDADPVTVAAPDGVDVSVAVDGKSVDIEEPAPIEEEEEEESSNEPEAPEEPVAAEEPVVEEPAAPEEEEEEEEEEL